MPNFKLTDVEPDVVPVPDDGSLGFGIGHDAGELELLVLPYVDALAGSVAADLYWRGRHCKNKA